MTIIIKWNEPGRRRLAMPCRQRQIDVARGTLKCGPSLGLAPRTGVIVLCLDRPCSAPPPRPLPLRHARPTSSRLVPPPALSAPSPSLCDDVTTSAAFVDCSCLARILAVTANRFSIVPLLGTACAPVHACSLDSGPPRYDSLTVSDSPPSQLVLCSLSRHSSSPPTPHKHQKPQ